MRTFHKSGQRRKAQVLTADFIMGTMIFILVIIVSTTLWNHVYDRSSWLDNAEEMQRRGFYITDLLINSPGIPENWNATTVMSLGLKESGSDILDTRKLIELNFMDYDQSKTLMGLGSFDYYLNISDANGNQIRAQGPVHGRAAIASSKQFDNLARILLENYSESWDYYWPENDIDDVPDNLATDVYVGVNEKAIVAILIDNLSSYDTVIFEGLQNNVFGDVPGGDAAAEAALQDFVSNGGTLIDINDNGAANYAQLISHFPGINAHDTTAGDDTGTVVQNDVILARSRVGDVLEFDTQKYKFRSDEATKPIAESNVDTSPDKYCIVCMWEYGSGKVYYMPDIADYTGQPMSGIDFDGVEIVFGDYDIVDAKNIIPVKRLVMVQGQNKIETGTLNYYIYD